MTLEELLECSAEQLEKMTDAELLEHFKQYLNVTRPELAPKPQQQRNYSSVQNNRPKVTTKHLDTLRKLNIDPRLLGL